MQALAVAKERFPWWMRQAGLALGLATGLWWFLFTLLSALSEYPGFPLIMGLLAPWVANIFAQRVT